MGLAALAAFAYAASPVFWQVSTQEEFLRGHVEQVSIVDAGRLELGPRTETVYEATAPFLWSAVRLGEALVVGSGPEGRVFRIAANGDATLVYDAAEADVHAVAPAADGTFYVGTSPDGQVVRVTPDEAEAVFDPDETYIWTMAVAADGTLFVGTGDPGRIYQVAPDGTASLLYDAQATHVLALAFDPDGNVLAGTGGGGQIVRIGRDGRAFVMLDSPFDEVRALRRGPGGQVYAVAVGGSTEAATPSTASPTPAASPGTPTVSTSTTVTVVGAAPAQATPAPATPPASSNGSTPPGRGAVYRIEPDGIWDVVWESSVDAPYDLMVASDGSLLIGTGNGGKIFRIVEQPASVTLLTRAPAEQVMRLVGLPDGALQVITANPGTVLRMSSARASMGTYTSDVRDTGTVTRWGTLRWDGVTPHDSAIRLFTRSGNTATPGETWSAWSGPHEDPDGSQIASPPARYLQWRAELRGDEVTPTLRSVTTAYLPRNLRPEVTSLTVHQPGVVFQRSFPAGDPPIAGLDDRVTPRNGGNGAGAGSQASTLGRRVYRKGLQTFVWTGRDRNEDRLEYDLEVRGEGDDTWEALARELTGTIFTWDTTATPDGTYRVRVVASDAASNAPGTELTGTAESAPFEIDNSPPRIQVESSTQDADTGRIAVIVSDAQTPVRHVEYSVDAERWQVVYPADGIPDSREERFLITVDPRLAPRLVIRASDALGNTATAAAR